MNIPALRKLDAMLIVSLSVTAGELDRITKLFYSNQMTMNRSTWITSRAPTSSGMFPETKMTPRIERMTNGGTLDPRFLPTGFQKHPANGYKIRRKL